MTLVRYNPWREMNSLQRQLNRLFDDALIPEGWGDFSNLAKVPAAELTETNEALQATNLRRDKRNEERES